MASFRRARKKLDADGVEEEQQQQEEEEEEEEERQQQQQQQTLRSNRATSQS